MYLHESLSNYCSNSANIELGKCLSKYELESLGNSMVEFMLELLITEFGQNHPCYVLITLPIATNERINPIECDI